MDEELIIIRIGIYKEETIRHIYLQRQSTLTNESAAASVFFQSLEEECVVIF